MEKSWQKQALYIQNVANTTFNQIKSSTGFSEKSEEEEMHKENYPQDLWEKIGSKIFAQLYLNKGFSDKTLGKIIGAGHPDNAGKDWVLAGDILPKVSVTGGTALNELAAATLVATKVNHMRGNRP